jgi:FAD/FMN-containing dehydrogenase
MTEALPSGPHRLDWTALARSLRGPVTRPADDDWDEARRAWNLAADQRPEAVVHAESAGDIVDVIRFAGENDLRVAPQGTGHFAKARASLEGAVLLRTDRLRGIEIDADARAARVEAGVLWQELTDAAAAHGLTGLAGTSPDVGVVGYTLGGGLSWLARKHGFAANSVRAVDVVTADGRLVRADREHESDLFWALRGGGGSFGVVTSMELELFPVRELVAGVLFWPVERAREVIAAWSEWVAAVPDEVTSVGRLMQFPPLPEVPDPLRGNAFVLVEAAILGGDAGAEPLLQPLRALAPAIDTFATIPVRALSSLHMDPPGPVPGVGDGGLLTELPPQAVEVLVEAAAIGSGSPLLSVELRHLGGALARTTRGQGAAGVIEDPFALFAVGITPDDDTKAAVADHVARLRAALAPWESERTFFNFTERRAEGRSLFGELAYERLRDVRARYDPSRLLDTVHAV